MNPMRFIRQMCGFSEKVFVPTDNSGRPRGVVSKVTADLLSRFDDDANFLVVENEPAVGPDFTAHESQREHRPLKANGQAWVAARIWLGGVGMSVQDYVALLKERGLVSNHPDERMAEARKWLARYGVVVTWRWVGAGRTKHKVWSLDRKEATPANLQRAKVALGLAA